MLRLPFSGLSDMDDFGQSHPMDAMEDDVDKAEAPV